MRRAGCAALAAAALTTTLLIPGRPALAAPAEVPFGPEPFLVKDVNAGDHGSYPDFGVAVGQRLFFSAYTPATGLELAVSDGTPGGTRVLDKLPGEPALNPMNLVSYKGKAYFSGTDASGDAELWVSDGTRRGTKRVKELNALGSAAPELAVTGGRLMIAATTSDGGTNVGKEPWVSDGTAAGTTFLGDLNPGPDSSQPDDFVATGLGRVVFAAIEAGSGSELWSTDGTAAGTYALELRPGSSGGFFGDVAPAPGGGVVLTGNDGTTGEEPYWTDGVDMTAAHWRSLGDLHPSGDSDPYSFVRLGGYTYFSGNVPSGNGELFRTDGTPAGTEKLTGDDARSMTPLAHMKGDLYGYGYGEAGVELFRYTPGGAVQFLGELPNSSGPAYAYPEDLVPVGGRLYFALGRGDEGAEVWQTDGTTSGQVLIDLVPGPDGSEPTLVPWVVGRTIAWRATGPGVGEELFAYTTRSSTTTALPARSYSLTEAREKRIRVPVRVGPRTAKLDGTVVLTEGGQQIGRGVLVDGIARVRIKKRLGVGAHAIRATYQGSWDARRSTSETVDVVVAR